MFGATCKVEESGTTGFWEINPLNERFLLSDIGGNASGHFYFNGGKVVVANACSFTYNDGNANKNYKVAPQGYVDTAINTAIGSALEGDS